MAERGKKKLVNITVRSGFLFLIGEICLDYPEETCGFKGTVKKNLGKIFQSLIISKTDRLCQFRMSESKPEEYFKCLFSTLKHLIIT